MRVLVTGASGHIGGAVASALAAAEHEVVAASRSRPTAASMAHVEFDLLDPGFAETIQRSAGRCDAIVHAAACMDASFDRAEISRANCEGTHRMILLARAWGNVPFVFISGVGVIGEPRHHPVTEAQPALPSSAYTASKLYGEHLSRIYGDSSGRAPILRVSSPVGPGMRNRRIFSLFVEAAARGETICVSDSERRQDYVDVRDVGDAVVEALAAGVNGLYNIASGRPVSNAELARRAVAALRSDSKIELAPEQAVSAPAMWDVSIEAATKAFGYAPARTLEESIVDFARTLSVR